MPQELPGFYYDPVKNRYFPIKGPIPGSSPLNKKLSPEPTKVLGPSKKDSRISTLVHYRELCGNTINFNNRKGSFEEEYTKKLASQPKVWKFQGLDGDGDGALTVVNIDIETPLGQYRGNALLTGSVNGSLSLFDIGNIGQHCNHGVKTTSDCVWPESNEPECSETPKDIWKLNGATLILPSSVSSISMPRKQCFCTDNDSPVVQRALVTTLGSELSGGSLYTLNLGDPVDPNSSVPAIGRLRELASLNCTIWGADSIYSGCKAVVGTNLGATLVDMETGVQSMLCRSKSDVLSVQFIHSGNALLCGLRNGAVVTVDARQRQRQLARHRIPYANHEAREPSTRTAQRTTKPWFVMRGNIQPAATIYMPSAVSCLVSLQMYDQYFLASSMDGSIRLYDHRLTKRGPIQSYEGHVNSHSRIQLGIDANERFVISGAEDCKVRIWSIKSGEMLFQEKFSSSIPSAVCWQGNGGSSMLNEEKQSLVDCQGWDAWLGSADGLFRMQFP